MTEKDKATLTKLIEIVDQISIGSKPMEISADEFKTADDPLLNELCDRLCKLNNQYRNSYQFVLDLACDKLNTKTPTQTLFVNPYKQLQSELRYLTWQIKQVAEGDYSQRVFFSGDFSYAINKMVLALRKRHDLMNKLEESNKNTDQLFSFIARDLSDPFNVVIGFSGVLMEAVENNDQHKIKECAEMINSSSFRIHDLLMNLLEWSRLKSDGIEMSVQELDLKNVIHSTIRMADVAASLKDITIHYDDPTTYPVYTDKGMLKTILRNIINNAIKYTPENGRVAISVRRDYKSYYISVQDNGIGMSEKTIQDVLHLKTIHSSPGTNNEPGTGLGLILSNDFAHMMGGEITAESKMRGGTTVTFSLPVYSS